MKERRYWHGLDRETRPLGFGCWQIAGAHSKNGAPHGWGQISEQEALALLVEAMANGVDFFDTAQGYNSGMSEALLGKAMAIAGADPVVCSKIELEAFETTNLCLCDSFKARVESSLKRLNKQRLDILLIHNPPDTLNWPAFDRGGLEDLKQEGKIGTYGISSSGLKGAINAAEAGFGNTIEWVLNLFERRPVTELFPILSEARMNFIARSPLSRGLINTNYLAVEPKFGSDDFRSTLPADWVDWVVASLRAFHANGVPESELVRQALTYCIQHDQVTAAIVGVKSVAQLEAIMAINLEITQAIEVKKEMLDHIPSCYPPWR